MLTIRRAVAAAVLVLPTSWLIACASSDGTGSGGSDFTGSASKAPAQKKTDAGSEASAPKPVAATCRSKPTFDACMTCCIPNNGDPFVAADRAADACMQKAAQKCGSACVASVTVTDAGTGEADPGSDYDPNAPDPCAACQADFDICDDVGANACNADPTCAGARKCLDDANCDAKDSADDGGVESVPTPAPAGTSG